MGLASSGGDFVRIGAALACVALGSAVTSAGATEQSPPTVEQSLAQIVAAAHGRAKVERSRTSGLVRFAAFPEGIPAGAPSMVSTSAEASARAFLRAYGRAFGMSAEPEVVVRRIMGRDGAGMEHVVFQQFHRGLPVTGAELAVHLRGPLVTAVNGRTLDSAEFALVDIRAKVPAGQAKATAQAVVFEQHGMVAARLSAPRLEVFNRGLLESRASRSRLAWFVEATAPAVDELVWVDALTGAVLLHFNQRPDARHRLVYTAGNMETLPGTLVRSEGQTSSGDAEVDAAYRHAGDTYDYFWSRFERDSIDGAGQTLVLTVHFGSGYENAFWDPYREQLAFGDGSAQADDVVGHEIVHGLTQHTANLYYYSQSGALNEAFSDIFGETIDLSNGTGNDGPAARWLAAEDWLGVGPIRSMMDPGAFGDPGRVGDPLFVCGPFDNGGVHTNSGVLNHAYAIAVDGGTYNGRTVVGVGLDKAGGVFYRALTTYLTIASDFEDADSALRQSCSDLLGELSPDCIEIGKALDAVELAAPVPCVDPVVHVSKVGTATGRVTSSPAGIDCGDVCEASFPELIDVDFTATPDAGAVFAGWSGPCSGTGTCRVYAQDGLTVTAQFDTVGTTYPLSVSTVASGTVTSVPAGIDCGTDCGESYPAGTTVELQWSAPAGYALQAWSGDCSGPDACRVTMNGAKMVTATFAATSFDEAATLTGVNDSAAAFGDYDNDGDLDLVVAGYDEDWGARTTLYRNDAGMLVNSGVALAGVGGSLGAWVRWADYDGDGDLDLLLVGSGASRLYRNNGGAFSSVSAPFPTLAWTSGAAWGDYDNDGDLDLVIAGTTAYDTSTAVTKLYRNDHGTFVDTQISLPGLYYGDLAWGDYDNDGWLDLAAIGRTSASQATLVLYHNVQGTLVDVHASLAGAALGSVCWADYDSDGDLDLVVAGDYDATRVYRNDGGAFGAAPTQLTGVVTGGAFWGDADADGNPDLLVTGAVHDGDGTYSSVTRLYLNDSGSFSETFTGFPNVERGGTAWGDYDGDGRLDVVVHGDVRVDDWTGPKTAGVFHNGWPSASTPPQPPATLRAEVVGREVRLSWDAAADAETPTPGLSYNLRVGRTPDGTDVVPSMADPTTGHRLIPATGNAGPNTSLLLHDLPPGVYYWAAQAIDAGFAASSFSEQGSFTVVPAVAVVKQGSGAGVVTSSPPGIDCGDTCTADFPADSGVTLTATAAPGSLFTGWGGACTGAEPCILTMEAPKSVTATFDLDPALQILSVFVTGGGKVVSTPPGIDCPGSCSSPFVTGSTITLQATPTPGWTWAFQDWGGACSGQGACSPLMDAPKTVTATFTASAAFEQAASLTGGYGGDGQWGDFDADGDLDLAVAAETQQAAATLTRVYRNDGGTFSDSGASLRGVNRLTRWGDYDNDGDLDLLVGGWSAAPTTGHVVQLYRNDDGTFVPLSVGMPAVTGVNDAAWGDLDGDGDLDLALAGITTASARFSRVYRNDHGVFVDVAAGLIGGKSVAWGDYDRDGDLDLLVGGYYVATHVYRNDDGLLVDAVSDLLGVDYGAAGWVDYDGDGAPDIVVSGLPWGGTLTTSLYRNQAGAFTEVATPFIGAYARPIWGDVDADGDLDATIFGQGATRLYLNLGGTFTEVPSGLPDFAAGGAGSWGDFDDDGRLDLFVIGYSGGPKAVVYRNVVAQTNTPPSAPSAPAVSLLSEGAELSWAPAMDDRTAAAALSYNVRLGTTPDGSEISSAMADSTTGYRRVAANGNAGENTRFVLKTLPGGRYYWAVQAIDNSFAGSPFAQTATFIVDPRLLSVAKQGAGAGLVTSMPAGIECGATCEASFAPGEAVTLSALPDSGSAFSGWSGDCGPDGTVTMNANRACTAVFIGAPRTLVVTKVGSGDGIVTSSPAGIECGSDCSATFDNGTVVTLTAAPAAGSIFTGWSGGCTGTGVCELPMDADRSVTASFIDEDSQHELTHGSDEWQSLAAPGGVAHVAYYRIAQQPRSSYEVLVEGASGDVQPVQLERLDADYSTVLTPAARAVGSGAAVSLRWHNTATNVVTAQRIRVRSGGSCSADCGADDTYRVRAYETTCTIPRFKNSGTQSTALILQNPAGYAIKGAAHFWDGAGTLLASSEFDLGAKQTLVLNTSTLPALSGKAGSISIAHDGRYGDLVGKSVELEPATGFSFDSAMEVRSH